MPAHFKLTKKRKGQPEFVERKREMPAPRMLAEPSLSAPVTPKPVQSELPLAKAPEVNNDGVAWDSSSEIE